MLAMQCSCLEAAGHHQGHVCLEGCHMQDAARELSKPDSSEVTQEINDMQVEMGRKCDRRNDIMDQCHLHILDSSGLWAKVQRHVMWCFGNGLETSQPFSYLSSSASASGSTRVHLETGSAIGSGARSAVASGAASGSSG